jgi:hypothetical protein
MSVMLLDQDDQIVRSTENPFIKKRGCLSVCKCKRESDLAQKQKIALHHSQYYL